MKNARELHNAAMKYSLIAEDHKKAKDYSAMEAAYSEAYENEINAAHLTNDIENPDPPRVMLYINAGWLALKANLLEEAVNAVLQGISIEPRFGIYDLIQLNMEIMKALFRAIDKSGPIECGCSEWSLFGIEAWNYRARFGVHPSCDKHKDVKILWECMKADMLLNNKLNK